MIPLMITTTSANGDEPEPPTHVATTHDIVTTFCIFVYITLSISFYHMRNSRGRRKRGEFDAWLIGRERVGEKENESENKRKKTLQITTEET
jgi:hypothetical protein